MLLPEGRRTCLFVLLLALRAASALRGPAGQSLRGTWKLSNGNGSLALSGAVPGCAHTALLREGLIQVLCIAGQAASAGAPLARKWDGCAQPLLARSFPDLCFLLLTFALVEDLPVAGGRLFTALPHLMWMDGHWPPKVVRRKEQCSTPPFCSFYT